MRVLLEEINQETKERMHKSIDAFSMSLTKIR
ncbi:uncharacterized protein METZ01_LOCUS102415, partial [marine metagenome]